MERSLDYARDDIIALGMTMWGEGIKVLKMRGEEKKNVSLFGQMK